MKTIKQLFPACLFGLLLLFASCKKWLDVNPKTQVKEEAQFSSKQGYTDALFGIYQNAAKSSGYGRNLSFGLLDILAQRYENKTLSTSLYYKIAHYNYKDADVRSLTDAVFTNGYGSIAQTNYILKNIDNSQAVLDETSRSIIKGEALGMRGFLHFDLARLFSERYADGANAGTVSIAYMKEFTVKPQARLSLGAVLDLCEADLKAAEALLSVNQNIDQIAGNQGSTNADLFLQFRQNHLNYWAVKATLARLYLFKGDKANAYKYANDVINSQKFSFVVPSALNVDATALSSDLTFSSEHVFSIYVSGLKVVADDVFKNTTPTGEISDLWSTRTKLDAMFQASLVGYGTDIRKPGASKNLWSEVTTSIVYTKKYWCDNDLNVRQRIIPVIRLAELYYIAAECAPTMEEGINYLNTVRVNRLIPALAVPATRDAFESEILLEYRKEFYAEGQLWFYFKRKNTVTIPDGAANPMTKDNYIFPLPDAEVEFGTSGTN
nr:RagB/SusD family nutrient uptake outer membrane protein [Pedobacter sp. ASV19]